MPVNSEFPDDKGIEYPVDQLDKRISNRNTAPAIPALSLQENIAHQGYIIDSSYRRAASRTLRCRIDYGLFTGNSINTDVEEGPDNGPKNKNYDEHGQIRPPRQ